MWFLRRVSVVIRVAMSLVNTLLLLSTILICL